jgi:hypothetical protein
VITKRLLLVAVVVAGGLTACGKDTVKPAASGEPATSATTEETTTTTEPPEAATSIELIGTEFAYTASGDAEEAPLAAGPVTVTLQNAGVEEHQISIVKLKDGKTMDDFAALATDLSQFDDVLETWGGPNGVGPAEENTTTQVLEAGDYLFACFIPSPDGLPHVVKGMLLPVTVEDTDDEAEDATADDELTLSDYTFGLGTAEEPAEIDAGAWRFVNDGPQPHEAVVYAPAEGATNQDVLAYFSNPEPAGPPPIVPAGGIGPIDAGRETVAELAPGDYVFLCFIPDAADGAPHFVKGMIEFAKVT